jgi:hypothetical protein
MNRVIKSKRDFVSFIKQKDIKLKILIAIPRSNSTIIELTLGISPSVSKIIHEPFLDFGYYNAEISSAYQKIFSVINAAGRKKNIFLIKERWLTG